MTAAHDKKGQEWWKKAVFYQIYPRSFMDLNGDGIGDLPGITDKLPYLAELGIDAIWISPFFKSPMKDFGYDVSDYCDVDPMFGTLADFDALVARAHELDIKVMIDQVLSHTSDRHPWFRESRKGAAGDKADWYVWADPKADGSPPNNWQSIFGGPAWHFDVFRGQYYFHNFLKEQPDLNYHNPEVQSAILASCKFWLERGIDGFRLDTVNMYVHGKELQDNPPRTHDPHATDFATQLEAKDPYSMQSHIFDKSQPENLDFIRRLRTLSDQYGATVLLGEIGDDNPYERSAEYTSGNELLHTAYNTHLMSGERKKLTASLIRKPVEMEIKYGKGESWPSWAFSNHDVVRVFSRWGEDRHDHDPLFKKTVLALLLSLRGTIFLYQGDELGLTESKLRYEDLQDPWGIHLWPQWQGRDGCRTPMPWRGGAPYAGFNPGGAQAQPWLPVDEQHKEMAADVQMADENSVWAFTRDVLKMRRGHSALQFGDIQFHDYGEGILAFERRFEGDKVLCVFHLEPWQTGIDLPAGYKAQTQIMGLNSRVDDAERLSLDHFGFALIQG